MNSLSYWLKRHWSAGSAGIYHLNEAQLHRASVASSEFCGFLCSNTTVRSYYRKGKMSTLSPPLSLSTLPSEIQNAISSLLDSFDRLILRTTSRRFRTRIPITIDDLFTAKQALFSREKHLLGCHDCYASEEQTEEDGVADPLHGLASIAD
jgi:hypothetical protein